MIELSLTDEQQQLQATARKFADEVMTPVAQEHDEKHQFPHDVIAQAFELGLLNLGVPAEYGGVGFSVTLSLVFTPTVYHWLHRKSEPERSPLTRLREAWSS